MSYHNWTEKEVDDFFSQLREKSTKRPFLVKGDVELETSKRYECYDHNVDLMYDEKNEFYYCPICEK